MLREWLAPYRDLPDVWGEGAIFAFSGMDGESNSESGFVATYGREPYGLLFHTPTRRVLSMQLPVAGAVRAALNDLYAVETPGGDLLVTFSAWHTLVGAMPAGTTMTLRAENGPEARREGRFWVSEDAEHGDVLAGVEEGERWSLAYGRSVREACDRADAGLRVDLEEVVAARFAYLREVPEVADGESARLLAKAVSVMKVNSLTPEGIIERNWSTPDRVPHRHMWLWDSVFHALAMTRLDPDLAWDYLAAMLDRQREDGMIPHMNQVSGRQSRITQPPILAWGVWENYRVSGDRERLEYAVPRLERYLEWDLQNRDRNSNGLLEWYIEGDVRSRSGESGLDNSPRFDAATLLDAVDFSTFAALDMGYLARMARELRQDERAERWQARTAEVTERIHAYLWHAEDRFYYDRELDGAWSRVRAVTGFLPLLLDGMPEERVDALVAALRDPAAFGTAFPIPTVAASHPEYSTDMWRGATWLNMNYLVYLGLRKQGRSDEADRLARESLAFVDKYYRQFGVLFEFYDSADAVPPTECERKGPRRGAYDIRVKMDSIRDYHWTAAVTAIWLLDGYTPA